MLVTHSSLGFCWVVANHDFLRRFIFNNTRIPMTLMYGGFPVRLQTHVGDPIYPKPGMTAEDLRVLTVDKMQSMINKHQHIMPGQIVPAVKQNLITPRKSAFDTKSVQSMPHNKTPVNGNAIQCAFLLSVTRNFTVLRSFQRSHRFPSGGH